MDCGSSASVRSILILFLLAVPAFAESAVSFRAQIAPLLHRRCARCHNEDSAKGRYRLDSLARLWKTGESDLPPVVAGRPQESELYLRLVETSADDRMPQKADALPGDEIALVERWIREGAVSDGGDPDRPIVELARESLLHAAPEHYPRPQPVTALAFSPDGSEIAVSGYCELTIWNAVSGALVRRIGGMPERITSIAWHPGRNAIAVAGGVPSQWGGVVLVDAAGGFQMKYLCDLSESALSVAFSPDGSQLAAGGGDRTVRIFDVARGKQTRILKQHADWVQSVAFSLDGRLLVSASRDRTARIFDVATGELEATYSEHNTPLLAAAFSGNGTVVSLARGRSINVWSAEKAERRAEFNDLDGEVQTLAVSTFGLLTAGADSVVHVYQLSDRRELFALLGHRDVVQALAVAPSGEVFASGGADGVVCVWSLACGTWVARFVASP